MKKIELEDLLEDLSTLLKFATINEKYDLKEARYMRKRIAKKLEYFFNQLNNNGKE